MRTNRDACAGQDEYLLRLGDESDRIVDRVVLLQLVAVAQSMHLRVSKRLVEQGGADSHSRQGHLEHTKLILDRHLGGLFGFGVSRSVELA